MASACMTMMDMCSSASRLQKRVHTTQTSSSLSNILPLTVMNQSPAADAHHAAKWRSRVRFDGSTMCKRRLTVENAHVGCSADTTDQQRRWSSCPGRRSQLLNEDLRMCRSTRWPDDQTILRWLRLCVHRLSAMLVFGHVSWCARQQGSQAWRCATG